MKRQDKTTGPSDAPAGGVKTGVFEIRLPDEGDGLDQDQEWADVRINGQWRRIRFHDYDEIYGIPGLYEALFYRRLECCSPRRVRTLLEDVLVEEGVSPDDLSVLDVGAGNGMVGEELVDLGAKQVIGIDIIEEARDAAMRDRPWVYDDYVVTDLCDPPEPVEESLREAAPNCLTTVAALGFGDIPGRAFLKALDLIETPGWLAFNIKEAFLYDDDRGGFCGLIRELARERVIRIDAHRRYQHRLDITEEPLHYVAMVARKLRDLPDRYLEKSA